MKLLNLCAAMLVCGLLVGCGGGGEAPQAEEPGWITLLDGTTLEGWDMSGDANWHVGDGFVEATSGFGYLVSPESYRDFELHVEFWVNDLANSGVFLRCSDTANISDMTAYEVNIYDTREDQTYRTGAIVNFSPPSEVINAAGQWNTFDISAEGEHLTVVFNGTETVNIEDATYAEGPIALQYGAGIVRFRNVRIRPL